jgi:hypothetical protein
MTKIKKQKTCSFKGKKKVKKVRKFNITKRVDEKISSCCHRVLVSVEHYNTIETEGEKIIIKHWRGCMYKKCGEKVEVSRPESCTCGQNTAKIVYEKCSHCCKKTSFAHFNTDGNHKRICAKCGSIEKLSTNFLDTTKIACSCGHK